MKSEFYFAGRSGGSHGGKAGILCLFLAAVLILSACAGTAGGADSGPSAGTTAGVQEEGSVPEHTESAEGGETGTEGSEASSENETEKESAEAGPGESGGGMKTGEETAGAEEQSGEMTDSEILELTEDTEDDGTLKRTIGEFNWKLYGNLNRERNLFYSPFSIASAVALADLAARGETKRGIEEALCMDDLAGFCRQLKVFRDGLEQGSGTRLYTANALWIDAALPLSGGYETAFRKPAQFYFGGDFHQADFRGALPEVRQEIADWVKENTEGFLSDYESGASEETSADILNAVYFYGEWENPFSAEDTRREDFHGKSGEKEADMMRLQDLSLRYLPDWKGIRAAAFPYNDGETEMDLFIPAEDREEDISELFLPEEAEELLSELDQAEETLITELKLPKFQMDLTLDHLSDLLREMGMEAAFTGQADFSALASPLQISDVLHRAKLEVDEEGSRAAAVTEVMMRLTSMPPEVSDPIRFLVDRPFLFVIRNRKNGVILFTGLVHDL